jgi:uncharacterized protein (TIGR00288 family)
MNRTTLKVMLLIDADNVSSDVIEQAAQRTMSEYGAIHVRRAYCNAETAVKQQALFKRLSVRPMVNISAGKNSTDIALAVDAIDLVIAERPDVVVLVSSDSDFAPLVIRLREKGCRVCGIGQKGKTGEDTVGVYDSFVDLAHQGARSAFVPAVAQPTSPVVSPAPAAPRKSAVKVAAKTPRSRATPAAKKTATRTAPRKTATAKAPETSKAAESVLEAMPALRSGKEVALNDIAQALRTAGLLGKRGSSLKLFDKLTSEFAVLQHPDRIRWTGATAD